MKINAVQMVRKIRERTSRETWGMSNAEIREYYRKGALEFEVRVKREAPGREARLKAMGLFDRPGRRVPTIKIPTSTRASESSAVSGGSVANGGAGYEAGEAAPAGAAISAKSGSAPD